MKIFSQKNCKNLKQRKKKIDKEKNAQVIKKGKKVKKYYGNKMGEIIWLEKLLLQIKELL